MELEYKTFNAEDGAEIKYIDEGEGKPFFYFYGMGSSIESQKLFIECLVKNFRCIVLDQRAYGKTAATDKDSIPQAARDGKALLDYLKIDKTVMMGYSMGGAVIFSYVQQFGCDRIEKILIGDMTPKIINEDGWNLGLYQGHYTREMFEQDLYYIKHDYKKFALTLAEQILFKNNPENPRNFEGTADEIRARIIAKNPNPAIMEGLFNGLVDITPDHIKSNYKYWSTLAGEDYREALSEITVPVGLICPVPGSIYSLETAKYIASRVKDGTVFPMDGCTHMAVGENRPKMMEYIEKFAL